MKDCSRNPFISIISKNYRVATCAVAVLMIFVAGSNGYAGRSWTGAAPANANTADDLRSPATRLTEDIKALHEDVRNALLAGDNTTATEQLDEAAKLLTSLERLGTESGDHTLQSDQALLLEQLTSR